MSTRNLILEGLQNNRKGATIGKCIKGLSDKDIKNILSNVVGDAKNKSLDLSTEVFQGMVVDIVDVNDYGNFKSYDIEIKSSKNKPWNSEWTKLFKSISGQKYNNGYMLTGYISKGDIKKDEDRVSNSLDKLHQEDTNNYKKLVGKKLGIYDEEQDDDFDIIKFSGKDAFTLKYSDGTTKNVNREYLLSNTNIEEYV